MRLLSPEELERDLTLLTSDGFCASPWAIIAEHAELLTPPEQISTTECAARYRYVPNPEGTGSRLWSPTLTPYVIGIQDALDDPEIEDVITVGPGQCGKTTAYENHLFKRLRFGPMTDVLWYMGSESEVGAYVDKVVTPMFDLHPEIACKVGTGRSDNKRTFKKIGTRFLEYLPVNNKTITQRKAAFIFGDEIDTYRAAYRASFMEQIRTRGSTIGKRRKGGAASHADAGWTSGIAAAWSDSTRGIWFWPCTSCGGWSSPHPRAPKGMHMRLDYVRLAGVEEDEMLAKVEQSAGLLCPHCGTVLGDADKTKMLAAGRWVFAGEVIDPDGAVTGERRSNRSAGFWIHGTMSPFVPLGQLARSYVAALVYFEKTKRPDRLREVTAKRLGEVFEGSGGAKALSAEGLKERVEAVETGFLSDTVPDDVLFVTAAVDVGGSKFDVMIVGWDLEGRAWIIARFTIRQRMVAGKMRDIRPAERQDDWLVLRDEVLRRELALASDPGRRMPVAGMAIDTGDGHVTWQAREFARRMARAGEWWGSADAPWQKVRLIKGAKSPDAPELPAKGRSVNVDEQGKPVTPAVLEWDLGVHKLKTQAVERLAEQDDGPGFVRFAADLPGSTFAEFVGEVLIDGKWERRGPNESLDLFGYNEAVRQMLRPERKAIRWDVKPPAWARTIAIGEAQMPEPKPKTSIFERFDALNRTEE